ncbi:unnamed protein product [Brachionus calyciflorus]|uniref:Uncharacterized protein n=1 Tax=Brachionus calyciflorus TaxID=104777 RepID=A0A813T418_9BILA|nr:unnamed protein product [Brachionus calyciflorus]
MNINFLKQHLIPFFIFVNIVLATNSKLINSNNYDESNDYSDEIALKSSPEETTSETTSTNDYYDSEDTTDNENQDFYDDEDFEAESDSSKPPYECPSQCKCIFNLRQETEHVKNEDDENLVNEENNDYYDHEKSDNYRKKRETSSSSSSNSTTSDYEYDYETHTSTKSPSRKKRSKYDIYIDCSSQNLNTISYLFSDDFPLDQIVSFNLSNNRFRLLKLDDGFEDLINLKMLDLSSNNNLKSLSPRNFLKKFRHLEKIYLNNLNQINCDQRSNTNKLIPIDCKWLRTLLYLYKRNITVIIDKPFKCDINKLVNSVSLMSRCFSDLYNSYRFTDSNQTLISADNSKYEFRIEPELNQILIEGDTLELTCKLKKINLLKKFRTKAPNFYKSQIKWFLNDQTQLMISTIYYTKDSPTQIQIIENKSKFKQDDLIESKLIITNTISTQHTGRYSCVASLHLNEKKLNINTSKVEIKVLTRHQLNILEPNSEEPKAKSSYCPEIITQTYKGIYKWPRTLANSKVTQKCTGFNSSATYFAIFECQSNGKWSDLMNLSDCLFESNLTKYLFDLNKEKRELNLEDFIKKIISIQSNDNGTVKQSLNKYDITFIQNYLVDLINRNMSELIKSTSWKHEFLFLNDMMSRLNEFYLKQAKLTDFKIFSNYFFDVLLEVLMSNFEQNFGTSNDMLSSYLASVSVSNPVFKNLKNRISCKIEKYQLTQQIYFKCDETIDQNVQSRIDFDPSMITSYTKNSKKLQILFFESDKLLPSVIVNQTISNLSNYDLINLVDYNRLLDSDELSESNDKLNSQIVGIMSTPNFNKPNNFNLTLEIKMPELYFRILSLIQLKVQLKQAEITRNNKNMTHRRIEKDKNLFDQIFIQNSMIAETNSLYLDLSSSTPTTQNNVLLMNKNLIFKNLDGSIQQIYDKHFLTNSKRLKNFKNLLEKNWFNFKNYEILYGMITNTTNSTHIEWSTKSTNSICILQNLQIAHNSSDSYKFRLFTNLKCNLTSKNSKMHFIGLRHSPDFNEISPIEDPSLASIIDLIDNYADLYRLDIKDDLYINKSLIGKIRKILTENYEFFEFKVLYFFAIITSLILMINIIVYCALKKCLLMPRSFQHCILNKWISVLFLILIYILGINQIYIPHLCLSTAILSHYLILTSFLWYILYYWCLYSKLRVLEKRNFNLIFNDNNVHLKKSDDYDDDEEYVKKPVVHLYMIGYGIPMLLVSIIISITKRDYVEIPYSICFTNEPNILIGSLILPVCFIFLVQLVLVGLIWVTLRRIVKDLKMEDFETKLEDPKINEDKNELCKNWVINKDLNVNDCIEIKTNPSTQKSLVNFNKDPAYSDSNTSFNSDSDRTSIMDTQHKPQIQLKFSLFSSILFLLICTTASCLSILDHHNKIFAYLLSLLLFIYSMLEISFYVLSRDDLFSLDLNFSFSFMNEKNEFKSEATSDLNSNGANSQDNNWYFEPNNEKNDCAKIDDLYEKFNFNDLNSTKKNVTNTILEEESIADDDHKKSISDVMFSAKKSQPLKAILNSPNDSGSSNSDMPSKPCLAVPEDLSDSTYTSSKIYESKSKKIKKNFYEEKYKSEEVIIEEYVSKIDSLIANNCLVNTGTAVETVASIAKIKPRNNRRSNGSVSSSIVSSSNDSNINTNHVTNPNIVVSSYLGDEDIYEDNGSYQQIYSNTSQRSSTCTTTGMVWQKNTTMPINNNKKSYSKNNNKNLRESILKPKQNLNINHETSV